MIMYGDCVLSTEYYTAAYRVRGAVEHDPSLGATGPLGNGSDLGWVGGWVDRWEWKKLLVGDVMSDNE